MLKLFKLLLRNGLINISALARLIEPDKPNAHKKFLNKVNEVQGQRMLDDDWDKIEEHLKGLK